MLADFVSGTTTEGVSFGNPAHFWVDTRTASLNLAIFAPYGGMVEPGTDICAAQIAGNDLSLHTVVSCRAVWEVEEGGSRLVPRPLRHHPDSVALAQKCQTIVSIRGRYACHNRTGEIRVGGLDAALAASISESLMSKDFIVRDGPRQGLAAQADNICNRGVRMRGVELDISHELMSHLLNDASRMASLVHAVRTGFQTVLPEC
jgi:phage replication-related protein YjqB (UPF0714/DUF867 family)